MHEKPELHTAKCTILVYKDTDPVCSMQHATMDMGLRIIGKWHPASLYDRHIPSDLHDNMMT